MKHPIFSLFPKRLIHFNPSFPESMSPLQSEAHIGVTREVIGETGRVCRASERDSCAPAQKSQDFGALGLSREHVMGNDLDLMVS
jgi:hypothetical protein